MIKERDGERIVHRLFFYLRLMDASISSISVLKLLSTSIKSFTVLQACNTVAWSRLPISCPILDAELSVCFLAKNMAIWRTWTISR